MLFCVLMMINDKGPEAVEQDWPQCGHCKRVHHYPCLSHEYEYDVSLTTSKPRSGHHQSQ